MRTPEKDRTADRAHPSRDAAREVIDLVTGAWRTQAVYVAVRLGIPDHVLAGRRTDATLAGATGVAADRMHRLLRLLAALGLVDDHPDDGYQLTATGELLVSDADGSLSELCLMYGEELYSTWRYAYDAIRDPSVTAFGLAVGQEVYDYYRDNNDAAIRFQHALRASNAVVCDAVAAEIDLSGRRIVDVGGGNGALLASILRTQPGTTGLLVDQPFMVPIAETELAEFMPDRAEVRVGDMFHSVPPGKDVYLLSRVLGDWDDTACMTLLANCRRVMSDSARLIVIERPVGRRSGTVLPELWDIHLLVLVQGRQRTATELDDLLTRSGFAPDGTVDLPLETTALVLRPA